MAHTYFAASYGPRFGDPVATFVALDPSSNHIVQSSTGMKCEAAVEKAITFELEDMPGYCDLNHDAPDEIGRSECSLCEPDITTSGAWTYTARDLFTAAELREHRRALLKGETIVLYPH